MSISEPNKLNESFASFESEELLRLTREGIVSIAYDRLDDAMEREATEGHVFFRHVAIDTPEEEALTILLTKDGIRPYQEEALSKEQITIYFSNNDTESILVEQVRDGEIERYNLNSESLAYIDGHNESFDEEITIEPTEEDVSRVVLPVNPPTEMRRLSLLREKIERFVLTPYS